MCSIVGLGICNKHRLLGREEALEKFITNLLLKGQIRGRDATGICAVTNKRVLYAKQKLEANSFVETPEYKKFLDEVVTIHDSDNDTEERLISVIGHNRAKTKGTKYINHNNHPIVTKDIVGVHNGNISNDDELFTRYETRLSEERHGQVDSEIIFQLINFFYNIEINKTDVTFKHEAFEAAVVHAAEKLHGGFACATINRRLPYKLCLFKNHMPLATCVYEDLGLFAFGSLNTFIEDAFEKSFEKVDVGPVTEIKVESNEVMMIDLEINAFRKLALNK